MYKVHHYILTFPLELCGLRSVFEPQVSWTLSSKLFLKLLLFLLYVCFLWAVHSVWIAYVNVCSFHWNGSNGVLAAVVMSSVSSSSVAQKIGLRRKSFKVFTDWSVLQECFIYLFFFFFNLVWSIIHLIGVLQQILILDCWIAIWILSDFLFLVLSVDLCHQHSMSSLCLFF